MIEREAAGEVQGLFTIAQKHFAQRRAGGAEGDGLELGAIVGSEGEADMPEPKGPAFSMV